jgi:hypothetical protein
MIVRNQNFHGNPVLARPRPPERVSPQRIGKKYSDALQLFMSLNGASPLAVKRRSRTRRARLSRTPVAFWRRPLSACKQRLDIGSRRGVTDPLRGLSGFSYDFVTATSAEFLHSTDFLDVCIAARGLLGRASG